MVTISRVEYKCLRRENVRLGAERVRLEAKIAAREQEQAQVITSLAPQNEWLLEQLKLSEKKLFGRSSESIYIKKGRSRETSSVKKRWKPACLGQ